MAASGYAQPMLYGITNSNSIFTIADVSTPSSISGPYTVSGVASGQQLVALDSRASDARLYALGYDSTSGSAQLYQISGSGTTYSAAAIGSATTGMTLGSTNNIAFDFIPDAGNQVRVIARNGNNYIMNADNGTIMATGASAMSFASGDLYSASSNTIAATAYTNNFYGSDATTEVGYDAANNVLVTYDAGNYANHFDNAGYSLHSIGVSTGALFNSGTSIGMDSWYDTATHTNTLYMTGNTLVSGTHLYSYNLNSLSTGLLTDMGRIGSGSMAVRDIAFMMSRDTTSPITGHLMAALTFNLRNIVWFDSNNPRNIRKMIKLSGMTTGQNMIAIDYSPFTGFLYGLGYNSTNQTYQIYKIDTVSGMTTAVNSTAASMDLGTDDGSGNRINAGFSFITTRINKARVMGNAGHTNLQLDITTGTLYATDANMQYITGDANYGASSDITSIAYTGYNGDTATQLFGYDANTGDMVTFDASNSAGGYGDGTTGYLNTGFNLNTTLSLLTHSNVYDNSYMDIGFDNSTSTNVGFIASNYMGDSSNQLNYSNLYDITGMLSTYHRGTSSTPTNNGEIGYGIPVKDIAIYKSASATPGLVQNIVGNFTNDLLVFPNPAVSQTRVVLPQASTSVVKVEVIDMNGIVEKTYSFDKGTYWLDLDISWMPTGLYSIRVYDNGDFHNLKVYKL